MPYSGGLLFTYTAGSTTKQNTYQDSAGSTANSNPIVLDSTGRVPFAVWGTTGVSYKLVLAPATDTDPPTSPIFTIDNVTPINDTAITVDQWVSGPAPTYVSATSFTLVGDQTTTFHVGRRLKTTNTAGTIYSTILTSVYTSLTTITVVNDSGTLDSGLSAVSYGIVSYANSSIPDVPKPNAAAVAGNIPPGAIMDFAGATAPTGWLECDGSAVSRTTYANLFTAVSTTWGAGDGASTFNLPDFRSKARIGKGTGTTTEAVTASSSNGFTVAANNTKWITGMTVVLSNLSGFTTSATAGPTYYVSRISSTNVRLATTLALAQKATPDVTISGTGTATLTHTFTARTLGEYGGEEAHAMSITELLAHTHSDNEMSGSGAGGPNPYPNVLGATTTGSTGGNAAMNVMNPFGATMAIIKF